MEHVTELLQGYCDKELDAKKAARVQGHVTECASCREALAELQSLSRLVAGLPREPLPVGFMQRLQRRREAPAAAAPRYFLPFPARMAAFALSSLIVTVVAYDKMKVLFPVSEMQGMISGAASNADLRLEAPNAQPRKTEAFGSLQKARALKGSSLESASKAKLAPKAARAPGAPIGGDQSLDAPGFDASAGLAGRGAGGGAAFNNDDQQIKNEEEKKTLGVKALVPPNREERFMMGRLAAVRGARDEMRAMALNQAAPASALGGAAIPAMLSPQGFSAAPGAAVAEEAKTPLELPPAGVVLQSEAERAALWTKYAMTLTPPRVDYDKDMLVVVFGGMDSGIEIAGVKTMADKIVVQYRASELPPEATRSTRAPSYQFRVVPKTGLPVLFEKLP